MIETRQSNPDSAAAVRRGKIRRRKTLSIVLILAAVAGIVFFVVGRVAKKDDPLTGVVTTKVTRTTITQVISATGSVTAQTGAQVRIGSQITGRIKRLFADVGTRVTAGQVIAELDLPDTRAQLDQAVASLHAAQLRLTEQRSGVEMQRTGVSSDIIKAQAGVNSAQASYNQAVHNADLQVNAAQAAVRQSQATNTNAQTFVKRNRQLLSQGYIAAQDVDTAQSQADVAAAQLDTAQQNFALAKSTAATNVQTAQEALRNAKAVLAASKANAANNVIKQQQVAEAKSAVEQAQAQVAYWQAQWAKTVIRTPISGTVLALDVQQGETIAAGLAAPTLIRVTDLNRLQVDAYVDETDIGGVHVGQPATVTVDAYPNRRFRGRVTKIASGATMQQNVVTYDTTLAVENPGGVLMPDMTATVRIVVGDHPDVLAVPIEAIKQGKRGQMVYVANGGKITPQRVMTGISNDTVTEVVRGLREDDTVVLAGYPPQNQAGGPGGARMTPFGPMGGGRTGGGGGGRSRGGQ